MNYRRPLLLIALLGSAWLPGCIRTENVRSDIQADRVRRFQQWRSEAAQIDVGRPNLSGGLSVDEAISTALVRSRAVEIALLQSDKARARLLEAYSSAMPTLDLDFTYTRLDEVSSFEVAPGVNVEVGDENNYAVHGTINQPLYRGGEVSAGVRAARLFTLLTVEQLRGSRQQVIYDTRRAYYEALLAIELEKATAEAIVVSRRLLDDTRKGFEAGTVSSFDVLRADVELKSLIAQNVQSQNRVHVAMTNLYNILGVSQESNVTLTDTLRYIPLTPRLDEAVRNAFLSNSGILQQELTVRLYEEAIAAARSGYFPTLDAFFTETYAKPDPKDQMNLHWNDAWTAGLVANWRLFDGFRTLSLVRQAETDYAQSRVRLRDTEENVLLALKQALYSLEDAEKAVLSQQANVEQATEAQRLVELGFREGVRKQVEVLDARQALTRAQAQYAQAIYEHETARLAYEQAIGVLDPTGPGFVSYPSTATFDTPMPEPTAQ